MSDHDEDIPSTRQHDLPRHGLPPHGVPVPPRGPNSHTMELTESQVRGDSPVPSFTAAPTAAGNPFGEDDDDDKTDPGSPAPAHEDETTEMPADFDASAFDASFDDGAFDDGAFDDDEPTQR